MFLHGTVTQKLRDSGHTEFMDYAEDGGGFPLYSVALSLCRWWLLLLLLLLSDKQQRVGRPNRPRQGQATIATMD